MNYRELLEELKKMSNEQLDLMVVSFRQDEGQYYAVDIVPAIQEDAEDILGGPEEVPYPVFIADPQAE
tara:strand:- start:1298 stop:1501 length:204 start_codon:yes stop_codon:yes gene_type:complete